MEIDAATHVISIIDSCRDLITTHKPKISQPSRHELMTIERNTEELGNTLGVPPRLERQTFKAVSRSDLAPMRILFVSHVPNNPNGGASRVYHLLAEALRERGHFVALHHFDDLRPPRSNLASLLVKRFIMPQFLSRRLSTKSWADFDVLMSSNGMIFPFFRRLRPVQDRPVLVNHVHGFHIFDHLANQNESILGHFPVSLPYRFVTGPLPVRWDQRGVTFSDVTIVQNLRDLSFAKECATDPAVEMIAPALHPELLEASRSTRPNAQRDRGKLLWFGTWEARKGAFYVPRALRLVRQQCPDVKLIVCGTGKSPNDILHQFADEDRNAVDIRPPMSIEQQIQLLKECSIFLFPSLSEGFGLAILEAMAFGLAAVTSYTGFAADALRDSRDAKVVFPSSEHIAHAVLELILSDELRTRIADAGTKLARSFDLARHADAYEAVFIKQLAKRRQLDFDGNSVAT